MVPNNSSPAKSMPEWLPDWKDVTQYPPPKADGRVWAWEFLRRNPQYRQLWEESAALPVGFIYHESVSDLEKRLEITERFEKEFGVRAPAPPPMASTDPDFEWRPMFVDQHIKYRMKPVDWPEDDEPYLIDEVLDDPAEVVIWFSLRLPLGRQVEAAEKLLEGQENALLAKGIIDNNHKMKPQYFQDNLRILDAAAMGAPPKENSSDDLWDRRRVSRPQGTAEGQPRVETREMAEGCRFQVFGPAAGVALS